jgi:hypothetical protein
MGPRSRKLAPLAATAALVILGLSACGGGDPGEGLLSNLDKARSARTLATLQQGLITVQTTSAEGGASSAPALAAALQQRDPSNRYTTVPPTDVGIVQVEGGGGGPVMLLGINSPPSSPRPPDYLAIWQSGGTTMFYVGPQPPQYTASPPSAAGWSASPPALS